MTREQNVPAKSLISYRILLSFLQPEKREREPRVSLALWMCFPKVSTGLQKQAIFLDEKVVKTHAVVSQCFQQKQQDGFEVLVPDLRRGALSR